MQRNTNRDAGETARMQVKMAKGKSREMPMMHRKDYNAEGDGPESRRNANMRQGK